MTKEYCNYAVTDAVTGVMLLYGEKYKAADGLEYVGICRSLHTRFRALRAYVRTAIIKGRKVVISYLFNVPIRTPWREVKNGGLLLGLQ